MAQPFDSYMQFMVRDALWKRANVGWALKIIVICL